MLSKELEEDGVTPRVLYPMVLPKTEYSLTDFGQTHVPIVHALCSWGKHYFELAGVPVPGQYPELSCHWIPNKWATSSL